MITRRQFIERMLAMGLTSSSIVALLETAACAPTATAVPPTALPTQSAKPALPAATAAPKATATPASPATAVPPTGTSSRVPQAYLSVVRGDDPPRWRSVPSRPWAG